MSDLAQLEHARKEALAEIEQRDLALKLYDNRLFKQLIVDQYMVKDAARFVQLSGDPALSLEQRADALAMGQAAGHLKRYLSVMVRTGDLAAERIKEIDATIEEVRAEGE